MAKRVAKSQKMAEPHAQAWNARARAVLGVRRGIRTCGNTVGAGRERDRGHARGRRGGARAGASQGG
jgi:hypothetical protein